MRHVLRLIPAELAGYLAVVVPLAVLGASSGMRLRFIQRAASVWPGAVSVMLLAGAVRA